MIRKKEAFCELTYRPQAGKSLREVLIQFIAREFPRLGGAWVVELFVDQLLQMVARYQIEWEKLAPGQTVWPAIALEEPGGYRKSVRRMRQVPVVITLVNQDDIAQLRQGAKLRAVLGKSWVRAMNDAYAQGGVLTFTDLSVLFHRDYSQISDWILAYEQETGQIVPRRGNVHDIGATTSHKKIICRKAYLEGKPTHVIARETNHSPEAVDRYVLDFARVYFATLQRGLDVEQTVFAIQRPKYLVKAYVAMIEEFGLTEQQITQRVGNKFPEPAEPQNERREQALVLQPPAPVSVGVK